MLKKITLCAAVLVSTVATAHDITLDLALIINDTATDSHKIITDTITMTDNEPVTLGHDDLLINLVAQDVSEEGLTVSCDVYQDTASEATSKAVVKARWGEEAIVNLGTAENNQSLIIVANHSHN